MIELLGNAGQLGFSPGTLQTRKCDANLTSVNCIAGAYSLSGRSGTRGDGASFALDRPIGIAPRPLLAQLDRAPGFEPGGWGFESLRAGQREMNLPGTYAHWQLVDGSNPFSVTSSQARAIKVASEASRIRRRGMKDAGRFGLRACRVISG